MAWLSTNLFLLSLLTVSVIVQSSDICDTACSCLNYESNFVIINCKGYKNHQPDIDFELFEWPKISDNRSIQAFFNNMTIHLLPKISGDSNVISINFDDNLIRNLPANPFEYFTNLETISIANNLIADLTKDFLKTSVNLKTLSLANNSLSSIDPVIVQHLKQLSEIDLSMNEFSKLSADLFEALSSVEIMRVERNKIFTIDNAYNRVEYQLRQLFLGYNQLTVITDSMFQKFVKLESIDLSNNKINNVDERAFSALESLKLLDLSSNNIKRVNVRLPDSLSILTFAHNQLITWPLASTPENLVELELQFNSLEYIFPKDREVDSLRSLDVSNNLIEHLPNTQFFLLERLDLSYNHLTTVPQNLNSMTPLLHYLILDGNRIDSVYFTEKTTLGSISLSYMPNLQSLDSEAFSNVVGIKAIPGESGTCIDLRMSHNKNLREIDVNALAGVDLCQLDLSYNQLITIPRNLTDWSKVHEEINLQGNPLSCNCTDQWMLDQILNKLYENTDHQFLLIDLKCDSPVDFKDLRLVQFLYHDEAFCGSNMPKRMEKMVQESSFGGFSLKSSEDRVEDNKNIKIELTHGPGFVIIIAMCALILVAMVLVGLRWQRDQDRKLAIRNRLYGYGY